MAKLSQIQVNPVPVIVVAVLAAAGLGYFFFIRPGQVESKIKENWATQEAAALRGPGRPVNASHEAFVAELRRKERTSGTGGRRRDRE
jgi:hypothetical protein